MKSKIKRKMLTITLIPIILVGIISVIITTFAFITYSKGEDEKYLKDIAVTSYELFDNTIPGDYVIKTVDGSKALYKGDVPINGRVELFDLLKDSTDLEYSFLFENTRVSTTIYDNNSYLLGVPLDEEVYLKVKNGDNPKSVYVTINGNKYLAYYLPVKSEGNVFIGFLGVAKSIKGIIIKRIEILAIITLSLIILLALTAMLILTYAKEITDCIDSIKDFVNNIAKERFNKRLDDHIYKRDDELGEIGRDITIMRNSLRDMVENDSLTEIYNKRTGYKKLEAIKERCDSNNRPYSLVIGDIDLFKRVNDRFGHDAGDIVLKEVAMIIKKKVSKYGFVSRWGGEEFMIGLEGMANEAATHLTMAILEEIRKSTIDYNGQVIDITMTYGIVSSNEEPDIDKMFKIADKRLYIGKESGRNKIVNK